LSKSGLLKAGLLVVVTAPSGSGKTTIYKRVLEKNPDLSFSVSYTTRKRRASEVQGIDYYFIDRRRFESMIERTDFVEWAVVHGELYGTERIQIERCLDENRVCILDVDVQGAINIIKDYPDAVTIFIQPPSLEELEERLRRRGTENEEEIRLRLMDAKNELEYKRRFKYIVVNRIAEDAIEEVEDIIEREKMTRT
jgi:guanylate kinase